MGAFGAEAGWSAGGGCACAAGRPTAGRSPIEPDASAAAYPFCAAAITGGRVRVEGFPADSIQADLVLLPILEQMGCHVRRDADTVEVTGPGAPARRRRRHERPARRRAGPGRGGPLREGTTHIRNVANLRIKETDRLAALETELRKLGANGGTGGFDAHRGRAGCGPPIETYDDHRMAMAFALAGLRIPGVVIRDPACVSKTWPDYFSSWSVSEARRRRSLLRGSPELPAAPVEATRARVEPGLGEPHERATGGAPSLGAAGAAVPDVL